MLEKIKTFFVLLFTMVSLLMVFPQNAKATPVTTNITPSISGYTSSANGGYGLQHTYKAEIAYTSQFVASVTANLPTNIKVISATLNLNGGFSVYRVDQDFGAIGHTGSFFGQTFYQFTWGYVDDPYSYAHRFSPVNRGFDVTSYFTNYTGGTQNFTISTLVGSDVPDWGYGFLNILPNSSYLTIVYAYVPSTPTISSPVAGSNNDTSVTLTASSNVVGGAPITYTWQYSTDGSTYYTLGSTTTSINWTIPGSIPLNSSIYVRAKATADGVDSVWSSATRFNKATDPAIAAKLAAESAEAKVFNMDTKITNLDTKITQIVNADTVVPTIADFGYSVDKATVTRTALNPFLLVATDNKSGNLTYRYSVNSGAFSGWQTLAGNSVSLDIGAAPGVKKVVVQVQDEAGNISSAKTTIFKL